MESEEFEEKQHEITETVARYQANHWRRMFYPVISLFLTVLVLLFAMGFTMLVRLGLECLGVSESIGEGVMVGLVLFGMFGTMFFLIWFDRRWQVDDSRVALPPPSPSYRRYTQWSQGLHIILSAVLIIGFDLIDAPPRFTPLLISILMITFPVKDLLLANYFKLHFLWQHPVWYSLLILYAGYAVAVALGMPELWARSPYCFLLRWALPFGMIFFDMILSSLYSRYQFYRLQRLVRKAPSEGGE